MTQKPENQPAFPTPLHNLVNDGMTLRDYFAAKASEEDIHQHTIYMPDDDTFSCRTREQARFAYAEAMLAARGQQ